MLTDIEVVELLIQASFMDFDEGTKFLWVYAGIKTIPEGKYQ